MRHSSFRHSIPARAATPAHATQPVVAGASVSSAHAHPKHRADRSGPTRWAAAASLASTSALSGCSDAGLVIAERLRQPTAEQAPGPSVSIGTTANAPASTPPPLPIVEGPLPRNCVGQLVTLDAIAETILQDMVSNDQDDVPFYRYVVLTPSFNAGVCKEDLAAERFAVNKAANLASIEPSVEPLTAVDADEVVYRLDLRNYNWDMPVAETPYETGWDAIVDSTPFAVALEGDQADQSLVITAAPVVWLYAGAFVKALSEPNVYYRLVGFAPENGADTYLRARLGVDRVLDLAAGRLTRAGARDPNTGEYWLQERLPFASGSGAVWQLQHLGPGEDLFRTPSATFSPTSSEGVFPLGNGLLAHFLTDSSGALVGELEPGPGETTLRRLPQLFQKYSEGPVYLLDEVRAEVLGAPSTLTATELANVERLYPDWVAVELGAEPERARVRAALLDLGIPFGGPEPVSEMIVRFDDVLDRAQMAGELGVTEAVYERNLSRLSAEVSPDLAAESLSREAFGRLFLAALCTLSVVNENQPKVDDCDRAIGALGPVGF